MNPRRSGLSSGLALRALGLAIACSYLGACGAGAPDTAPTAKAPTGSNPAAALRVTSPAFRDGAPIPAKHTCDGADVSPALAWEGTPKGTRSLALICDDPDAPGGTWVHWVLFCLPPSAKGLPEGVRKVVGLPDGSRQGLSDFKRTGYGGPCPPAGKPHRYFFKVYALDAALDLQGAVTKARLEAAMKGHILAQGALVGTYRR
jgi:Raf kinase inhibitor-like YbhB/YbcL family protein